jgi:hypothetical protein
MRSRHSLSSATGREDFGIFAFISHEGIRTARQELSHPQKIFSDFAFPVQPVARVSAPGRGVGSNEAIQRPEHVAATPKVRPVLSPLGRQVARPVLRSSFNDCVAAAGNFSADGPFPAIFSLNA